MKLASRLRYTSRETILKLLSDDEASRIGTAQNAVALVDGDEFIDLEAPELGVLRVLGPSSGPMTHLLARKAVEVQTWREILALLSAPRTKGSHSLN